MPTTATSVVLNVTVVRPATRGFISIRPGDATGSPATSNINWGAGGPNIANSVTVQLPVNGTINIFVNGTVGEVLIDVAGDYLPAAAGPEGPPGPQGEPGPGNVVPFFLYLDGGETETIGTAGPLSLEGECVDEGAGEFTARILGKTAVNDDVVQMGSNDFDGGATEGFLLDTTPADDRVMLSENSSDTQVENNIDDDAILTKSGHYIGVDGETTALGVNYGTGDCLLAGSYTFRVPPATP